MIPDYCDALVGYRCWNVFPNGLMCGQSYNEPWPPYQAMAARCGFAKSPGHVHDGAWVAPPVYGCGCGIHALKQIDAAERRIIEEAQAAVPGWYYVYENYMPPAGRVWGSIKLWGRVVEHDIGYRAEFAYPSQLYCQDKALAATVAALYGVPCDVKVLDIPTPQPLPAMQWITSPAMTYAGTSTTVSYPVNSSTIAPKPLSPLLALKALGATDWQKQQATPAPVPDWKAVMAKAFHVKKVTNAHG